MKNVIIEFKDFILKVSLSEDNTHIEDSFKVTKRSDMEGIIIKIRELESNSKLAINTRSLKGMIREWRAHNLLHTLGIYKDRTKSVDLEINQKCYLKIGYYILSLLYF